MHVRFLPVIAITFLVGCSHDFSPEKSPAAAQQMFASTSMRIHPIFTGAKDWTNDGRLDGIEAELEFQDQFGDPAKAAGKVLFELFDYSRNNPDPRGKRLANPWVGSIANVVEQQARWNRTTRTYSFQLAYPGVSVERDYVLTAIFEPTGGRRFFDRIIIQGHHEERKVVSPPTPPAPGRPPEPLSLEPVPTLLSRVRAELSAEFKPSRPIRVSRAPGRLDVMGGIADYTGSLVCEMPLDRAAAVALQERDDREVQVFSFNLLDENKPFTLRIPLDALAENSADDLRRGFNEPGRKWAGYLAGCLHILHEEGFVDLYDAKHKGLNLALLSNVPLGAGVSSSAAIEVATMMNLVDHFGLRAKRQMLQIATCKTLTPMKLAAMCQAVENRIVGAPCGIMDQVSSCYGEAGALLRMICQPHEIQPALQLPRGIRVLGINSNVKHSVGGGMYGRTRCAAFMGHKIILEKMRQMGAAAGKHLERDPMNGYLANLDPEDYKKFFRPYLPDSMKGGEFLLKHGSAIDTATKVEPDVNYHVQHATDHHVLEARRVKNFVEFLDHAGAERTRVAPDFPVSGIAREELNKSGHLMYASHLSYTNDAMLGAEECDLLVQLVREREPCGLYGAKITGGGSGGTVAILAEQGEKPDAAITEIMTEYEKRTGNQPEAFMGTSLGAWHAGTIES